METVLEGVLFDVQQRDDDLLLWIRDDEGHMHACLDQSRPVIFAEGPADLIDKLTRRLQTLRVLAEEPQRVERIHFYSNRPVLVTRYVLSKPSFLQTIHRKLYALFERMEIYHSDIEAPTLYLFQKGLIPTGRVRAWCINLEKGPLRAEGSAGAQAGDRIIPRRVSRIELLDDPEAFEYELPRLRLSYLSLTGSHRLGLVPPNRLRFACDAESVDLCVSEPMALLHGVNDFLSRQDPDVILSQYGDRTIFPGLFRLSRDLGIPLLFDRLPSRRRILTEGKSYFTYGSMIFRAASYHLYGRWHLDAHNSFVHREAGLDGVIQLARLSRTPVQRMARVSTGAAMTSIQIGVALRMNYLIPWQKSHREQPRTALELLESDKGGLVFEPEIRDGAVYENVAQIDFSQMYPTIMVHHNISPETVLCSCCRRDEQSEASADGVGRSRRPVWVDCDIVPETGFPICRKRRGIVPLSLESILHLRKYLKERKKKAATEEERRRAASRQDALKWLLVTCFGYLGYRNAKFGRLESHESVTAFGRLKILRAKEMSEDAGFHVLHAITDCLFLWPAPSSEEAGVLRLCESVGAALNVEMALEGIYSWIVFLPSRSDERQPVANRYFGRFTDGSMKVRGIQLRRRDTPEWIRRAQQSLLDVMQGATSLKALHALHGTMDRQYRALERELVSGDVAWRDLLVRRTVSRSLEDYTAVGASALSLEQLAEDGIQLQPGEKVRYLIRSKGHLDRRSRYLTEERALKEEDRGQCRPSYDVRAYGEMLREAYREIWGVFAPHGYFQALKDGQLRLPYEAVNQIQ